MGEKAMAVVNRHFHKLEMHATQRNPTQKLQPRVGVAKYRQVARSGTSKTLKNRTRILRASARGAHAAAPSAVGTALCSSCAHL